MVNVVARAEQLRVRLGVIERERDQLRAQNERLFEEGEALRAELNIVGSTRDHLRERVEELTVDVMRQSSQINRQRQAIRALLDAIDAELNSLPPPLWRAYSAAVEALS